LGGLQNQTFARYRNTPTQSRQLFEERAAARRCFRRAIRASRARIYQKCALEIVDGLYLHPLVGDTKGDDTPPTCGCAAMKCCWKTYYPVERVIWAAAAAMRYAGRVRPFSTR